MAYIPRGEERTGNLIQDKEGTPRRSMRDIFWQLDETRELHLPPLVGLFFLPVASPSLIFLSPWPNLFFFFILSLSLHVRGNPVLRHGRNEFPKYVWVLCFVSKAPFCLNLVGGCEFPLICPDGIYF